MNNDPLKSIVNCMATYKGMQEIQYVQTMHRLKLVEFWNIKEGSRVLEIGCGQGDTTAVLAYFVGRKGLVQGIDVAPPTYGSPISLGESAKHLMNSELGNQIRIDFGINILSQDVDFPENSFDYIVFSHSSWYLKSFDELNRVMQKVKKWGKQLCFAEWDARIDSIDQHPHLLSVLIQAQYESFKKSSESNIRTFFTPNDIRMIVEGSGWNILREEKIDSTHLQDGKWEVDMTLNFIDDELKKISNMPVKLKELIQSEVILLKEYMNNHAPIKSLSTYALLAN